MIILTQQSGGTNTAQIRTDKDRGWKVLYRASSTESEAAAARAVVRKYFGAAAAASVQQIPTAETPQHMPAGNNCRRPCNPAILWKFNPQAR